MAHKKSKSSKGKSSKSKAVSPPSFTQRKSVDIKKADNGFVVSSFSEKGEKVFIAKTKAEAKEHASMLLGV